MCHGGVAEWSCSGLQIRGRRFDSDLRLQIQSVVGSNFFYLKNSFAGIAQLVEHDLAKVGVASSSLVSRSRCKNKAPLIGALFFVA